MHVEPVSLHSAGPGGGGRGGAAEMGGGGGGGDTWRVRRPLRRRMIRLAGRARSAPSDPGAGRNPMVVLGGRSMPKRAMHSGPGTECIVVRTGRTDYETGMETRPCTRHRTTQVPTRCQRRRATAAPPPPHSGRRGRVRQPSLAVKTSGRRIGGARESLHRTRAAQLVMRSGMGRRRRSLERRGCSEG